MKNAEIICTGTELLIGNSIDTNSIFLSNHLEGVGVEVQYKTIVGDDGNQIEEVLRNALKRADIVILSGGLGPTVDDITRDIFAKVINEKLIFHQIIYDRILARIKTVHTGSSFPDTVKLQAYVPEGADYFLNQNGTAPGLATQFNKKILIALPGPPRELKPMWENQIQFWLIEKLSQKDIIKTLVLRTTGIPESIVDEKIGDLFRNSKNPKIGVCAHPGMVDIRLIGWGDSEIEANQKIIAVESQIRNILGDSIYGTNQDTLESVVGDLLRKKKLKLAVGESCTGGLIANRITNIPGSSDYFDQSIITYSNRAKIKMLGVPKGIIDEFGAVSEQTAFQMAQRLQAISGCDIAISVTGIAGPTGGSEQKPVGLVYLGLAKADKSIECYKYKFSGERELIKFRASQESLDRVRLYLLSL